MDTVTRLRMIRARGRGELTYTWATVCVDPGGIRRISSLSKYFDTSDPGNYSGLLRRSSSQTVNPRKRDDINSCTQKATGIEQSSADVICWLNFCLVSRLSED
jgi:hypothetical protein